MDEEIKEEVKTEEPIKDIPSVNETDKKLDDLMKEVINIKGKIYSLTPDTATEERTISNETKIKLKY